MKILGSGKTCSRLPDVRWIKGEEVEVIKATPLRKINV
jgi:hypothetical protein